MNDGATLENGSTDLYFLWCVRNCKYLGKLKVLFSIFHGRSLGGNIFTACGQRHQ